MSTSTADQPTGLEVAIVGMAGRFPGAPDLDIFWQNLRDGVEAIRFFSNADLLAAGVDPAILDHPNYVKAGGVLDGIDQFDAAFFGYSPREAALIDPQQRLFLELAWAALEHAGYDAETYAGEIGVFAGVSLNSYWINLYRNRDTRATIDEFQAMISNDRDHLTTRVSYKLDLKGPSVTVQTACSTSLVAVHMACQSLLSGGCDLVLAGGASIGVSQNTGYWYQEGSIHSPDGHCRAFDAQARGTVGGNGVGVVVLKRLDDALADGDTIHAVIKGSAINNDGALKVGYTAPSIEGQAKVIRAAQLMAEVDASTISYVEAHGTGTPVGDPIEVAALTRAFRAGGAARASCAIGSVKTNIGHLDAAAGVAGLIKTVLALQHRQIPPSLHFNAPNPQIDFASSPLYVNARVAAWETDGTARRAGVSSFGIGGTNAHVVLEEALPAAPASASRPWQLLLLSAKTSTALERITDNLGAYLRAHADLDLADVASTLQRGRRAFNYRRALVCRDREQAIALLENRDPKHVLTSAHVAQEPPIAFVFPGQGAQHAAMSAQLYREEPVFRAEVDRCAELLVPLLGRDLCAELYADTSAQSAEAAQRLNQTAFAQPALFVIEYALAQLWISWGVRPQALLGHSLGEYVAACLAGVFSLEDALALVVARGRLMQQLPSGAMLSVALPEHTLRPLLGATLDLAAVNGSASCVVSGTHQAVSALHEQLAAQGVATRLLHTSHAFHSAMMEPVIAAFAEQVGKVQRNSPHIPFLSNVTGTWISATEATDPHYWARHLRATVRFADGVQEVLREPNQIVLEVGPGQTLASLVRQQLGSPAQHIVLASLPHARAPQPEQAVLLETLGQLWLAGARIDWTSFAAHEHRRRVPLPTYPFERQRYWIDAPPEDSTDRGAVSEHQRAPADWLYIPSWKRSVPPALADNAPQHSWVLFLDQCGLGQQLARRLAHIGQQVVTVVAGERFEALGDRAYTIRPHQRDDYAALFEALATEDVVFSQIVHLWSVTRDAPTSSHERRIAQAQQFGFASLLLLAQALDLDDQDGQCALTVVTNNTHDINGETAMCPEKTTILGLCNVLPQEYPQLRCRSIDLVLPAAQHEQIERLTTTLLAELVTLTDDTTVAYRGNHRLVQSFAVIPGNALQLPQPRTNAVYMILGGLTGTGRLLADHLARTRHARLVLVEPITPADADPTIQQWRDLGAHVLVAQAALTDLEALRGVVTHATEQFGPIHGLFDMSYGGIAPAFQATCDLDYAACEQAMQGVAHRFDVLDALVRIAQPRFCLVQSSLAAIVGTPGTAVIAATSVLLDALLCQRSQTSSVAWVGVNWDTYAPHALPTIPPEQAAELFERILALTTVAQIVVSPGVLLELNRRNTRTALLADERPATSLHARPHTIQSTYAAPTNEIERRLAIIWQHLFGIEQVGTNDNFFELGGDSLLATQLVSRVRDAFEIELSLRSLFEISTLAELALLIADRLLEQIDQDFLLDLIDDTQDTA